MENRGLLFIPDISGFSRFVTDMEIEHSRHIMQELLEIIIDSNKIGLEISEVEGDAILFYKFGSPPDINVLYEQVKAMFCAFHTHLKAYESRRLCQCKACNTAVNLSLKVITHYGEFTGYNIKSFQKLIGKDVIVAHQLLKNDIEKHEYWLVTNDVTGNEPPGLADWMNWQRKTKSTDGGNVTFHYTHLSPLKEALTTDPMSEWEPKHKVRAISVSKDFDTDIKKLFYTTVHFEFRHLWLDGVKAIEDVEDFLPVVGTRHRCVVTNGSVYMYTSTFSYDPENIIVYGETDEKKNATVYFVYENKGEQGARITIELHMRKNPVLQLMFRLFMKKKYQRSFERSLKNLEGLLKKIEVPVEF